MTSPIPDPGSLVQLAELFDRDRDPQVILSARADAVDAIVIRAAAEFLCGSNTPELAVTAVGGYGRRELFPFSDIDLLIVVRTEAGFAGIETPLAHFLSSLWDSRLRVSHSTRTVAECCRFHRDNVELHISLLDQRFLAGSSQLFDTLTAQLTATNTRNAPAISQRLVALATQRHAQYNNTPYHLEPNLKESPGGIRDIHLLRWLAQLQPGQRFLQDTFLDAAGHQAKIFLFSVRCFLHFRANRDSNLLTFELQDEAARHLPFSAVSPENWMRCYFQHARRIFQRSLRALEFADVPEASLLRVFREWRSSLSTPEFLVTRNRVHLRNPAAILISSEALLRLFVFVGKHGIQLSWETQWRLEQDTAHVSTAFRFQAPGWELWRELLSQPHAGLALNQMQETGILAAALPLWSSIDSLVVRDFYHRYTVDEHTLLAIREIDRLVQPPPRTLDRFGGLAQEEDALPELRLTLLLHDLGKGITPGDHVRGSQIAASEAMNFMGVPEASRRTVQFLIEHHLDLSTIMNGRDLEDPATARFLTSQIDTAEDLRRLTLLTFADISAVNPTAMSPWRLEQLWRVYTLGSAQLTRELVSNRIHEAPSSGVSPRLARFLDGFPKRYIRTHSPQQIDHHLELEGESRRKGVAVEITRESGAYLMTVVTHDRGGLLASLCGVLASFGMNIVKGEASSNSEKSILDLIRFTDPNDTLALNPEELDRLKNTVAEVVKGHVKVNDLLKRRRSFRRPTSESAIVPWVYFDDSASDDATLIRFVGEDRPGLLHDLASAISEAECNIEVVMIDTEAHKAIDVFYVTHWGRKLDTFLKQRLEAGMMDAALV